MSSFRERVSDKRACPCHGNATRARGEHTARAALYRGGIFTEETAARERESSSWRDPPSRSPVFVNAPSLCVSGATGAADTHALLFAMGERERAPLITTVRGCRSQPFSYRLSCVSEEERRGFSVGRKEKPRALQGRS